MHASYSPTALTMFHRAANAGAGVAPPPPPSGNPFNAGRVDWKNPTARLTENVSEQEAQLLVGALVSGESLLIEVDVLLVVMQRALEKLNPGTHLMFDFAKLDSCKTPQEYQAVVVYYLSAFSSVPAGVNLHVCMNTHFHIMHLLVQRLNSACPVVFRRAPNTTLLDFVKSYTKATYLPILPEHSKESAIAIAQHAARNQVPICFEEGVALETIEAVCKATADLSIMLPLPKYLLDGDPFASLTDSGKSTKTLVPHASMSVAEIKKVAHCIHGVSLMLKMDPTMYSKAKIVDIANSMVPYGTLLLQTDDTASITRVAQNIGYFRALKIQPANAATMAAAASHLGYYGGLYIDASSQDYIATTASHLSKTGMLVLGKSVSADKAMQAVRKLNPGGLIIPLDVSDALFKAMAKALPKGCRINPEYTNLEIEGLVSLMGEMQKETVLCFNSDCSFGWDDMRRLISKATECSMKIELDCCRAQYLLSAKPGLMGWYTLDPTSGELVCYEGQDMSPYGFDGLPKPLVEAEADAVVP